MVDAVSPAMARSRVLLPLPLGPSSTKNSPSADGQGNVVDDRVALILFGDLVEGDGHAPERIPADR